MLEIDAAGMYDTAAEEMGKIFVTTELGGGGTARAETVRIAKRGVRNVLRHAGILAGPIDRLPTEWLDMPSDDCFVFAEEDGLIEPMIDLAGAVQQGDVLARIYPLGRTGLPIQTIHARISGVLTARHFRGLIKSGDCAAVVAVIRPCPAE